VLKIPLSINRPNEKLADIVAVCNFEGVQAGKDYYGILELKPGGSQAEVKRQFRRLAMRYHPDRHHGGNVETNAAYADVQEAYRVLSTPQLRQAYLQQRWLSRAAGRSQGSTKPQTPLTLLESCEQLRAYANGLDLYRMDHEGLAQALLQVLAPHQLTLLAAAQNKQVTRAVAEKLLDICALVRFDALQPVWKPLQALAELADMSPAYRTFATAKRKAYWWHKNQYWIIVLATVGICLMMVLT
jgi:hypothetical protein